MYHKIDDTIPADHLNVPPAQFEKHLEYLNAKGYTTISFSELIDYSNKNIALPPKAVMITADDGYRNNFTRMYPLIVKYNCKANIFLVSSSIGKLPSDEDGNLYLSLEDLREMNEQHIQYGLHTFDHKNYAPMDEADITEDLIKCKSQLSELGINFQPCFAYTYGSYPKKDELKRNKLFEILKNHNIQLAFRIGNRINKLPFGNKLLIKRIDIRGSDSFLDFKTKLQKGRLKLF